MGFTLKEWENDININAIQYEGEVSYGQSIISNFVETVKSCKFSYSLDFNGDPPDKKPLILLEDLPNITVNSIQDQVHAVFSEYLSSPIASAPIIVIISDTKEYSLSKHSFFPSSVLNSP